MFEIQCLVYGKHVVSSPRLRKKMEDKNVSRPSAGQIDILILFAKNTACLKTKAPSFMHQKVLFENE